MAHPLELDEYEKAIQALETSLDETAVIEALRSRDEIAQLISDNPSSVTDFGNFLASLVEIDTRFKRQSASIRRNFTREQIIAWRASRLPDTQSWWWFPDTVAGKNPQRLFIATNIASGIFLILAVGVFADIMSRYLLGGIQRWGIVALMSGSVFSLLSTTALAGLVRQWMSGSADERLARRRLIYSGILFLIAIALNCLLPRFSLSLYNQGMQLRSQGDGTEAFEHFALATSLNPYNARAHYALGNAYLDRLDLTKAADEFGLAARSDPHSALAYNGLALSYLLMNPKDTRAIDAASQAIKMERRDPQAAYAAHKNRAWALLEQNCPTMALKDVELAIYSAARAHPRLRAFEAHAIRARIWEKTSRFNKGQIEREWKKATDGRGESLQSYWIILAMERTANSSNKQRTKH